MADATVNTSSASYAEGYNSGKSNALESSRTYCYSGKATIWDYGDSTQQLGTYTASKNGKAVVSFVCVYHKTSGDGNPTITQKLYKNGSVISTSGYTGVLDLKAGDTIKGEVGLKFERSSSKSVIAFNTGALVVTEIN